MIIFRDDDISHLTAVNQFAEIHKLFRSRVILHTIALIAKDINKNPALIEFINANNIDVQLHCWKHYDLNNDLKVTADDLKKGCDTIEKYFNHRPNVLYPPWNKTSKGLEEVAANLGLTVSADKISLSQYIRHDGRFDDVVINFHSWAYPDVILLERGLDIYNRKRGIKLP